MHFLTTDIGEIRIFSRDEKKQDDMRHELQANYPDYYNKVKFYIGDVRNIQSLRDVMPGVNLSSMPLRSSRFLPASFSPWSCAHQH